MRVLLVAARALGIFGSNTRCASVQQRCTSRGPRSQRCPKLLEWGEVEVSIRERHFASPFYCCRLYQNPRAIAKIMSPIRGRVQCVTAFGFRARTRRKLVGRCFLRLALGLAVSEAWTSSGGGLLGRLPVFSLLSKLVVAVALPGSSCVSYLGFSGFSGVPSSLPRILLVRFAVGNPGGSPDSEAWTEAAQSTWLSHYVDASVWPRTTAWLYVAEGRSWDSTVGTGSHTHN